MPTSSVLVSKHPRIETVNPHTFDYENYAFEHIRVKLDEGVLVVTLYRPDNYNSFTNEMCHSLVFAFELADADDRVKAVVLTGHGKLFCAGADLNLGGGASFGADDDRPIKDHRDGGGQVTLSIAHCRKLVIAAVNGSAVGIGATMQLPCDIRIISSTAKIAFPFAKRGITTEACSAFYLPRLVGTSKALELVMTADTYKPDYPALLPLWREILPAEQVFPKSLELAKRLIKENSVVSMAIMKSLIYRAPDNPEETHLVDSQAIAATSAGDAVEGVKSFMEKRPASFKGTIKDLEKDAFLSFGGRKSRLIKQFVVQSFEPVEN